MVSLWLTCVCLVASSATLSDVEKYEVIRPQRRQERQRRSLQDDQVYPDTVRYELVIEGRNHTIHLEKNRNLIGRDYTETRYSEDGKRVITSPKEDHCFYHGHIEGMADSSASVGICSGISGFVRARQQVYVIEPLGATEDGDHAVYRWEHLKSNTTVLYDRDRDRDQDQDQDQGPRLAGLFRSRSWKTKPGGPQKFVELYVVVDNAEFRQYGEETKSRIFGVINHVDKLYRPLNIRIMLVGLDIWSFRDHIDVHEKSETTLDNFLLWRQNYLLPRKKHDNAQFVTGIDFEGNTVGLANKFAMCTENSGGVNQDHHNNLIGLASTIAHEMGHNLGVSHDTAGCVCGPSHSSGNCVMADQLRTSSQDFPEFFSGCSVNQLAEFLERAQPGCLHRPDSVNTVSAGRRCGNALLDPDEECDCGTVEECNNPCCDASTCRLTKGSRCAHGECCDSCQFQESGVMCRMSAGDCDLPEYCSGVSGECPDDSFQMNGKLCYNHAAGFCYNGRCPTRDQHCWRLFGEGAKEAPDICFNLNKKGLEGANCGKTKLGFTRCEPANVKCGSIFCDGGDTSITGRHAAYNVFRRECKLAVDDDRTRNIDMVPNGTHCGSNKVCLDYKCVNVSVYGKREDCAKKCNNNGVCNHKNECHCNPGWAPPHCDVQYADLIPGQSTIIAGVCMTLFVLIVITVVIVGLMYCKKDTVDNYISKRRVYSAPRKSNTMFHETSVKDKLQISHPTFIASTATRDGAPLIVMATRGRPAPQPPQTQSPESTTSETEPMKPLPPSKPLPTLNKAQYQAATPSPSSAPRVKLNPPVPPVKPSPPQAARTKPSLPPLPPAKPQLQTHMNSSSRVSSSTKAEDDHAEREIL